MPATTISSVYQGLLAAPQLSRQVQERILAFGIRTKNAELLSGLALHPALESEIDQELVKVNSAAVRAAWASRPGRPIDDLLALLERDSRSTVIAVFAEREDLPAEFFHTLAEKTTGQNALLALARNQSAPFEARKLAAVRMAKAMPSPGKTKNLEYSRDERISSLLATTPELAEPIAQVSGNIATLQLAVTSATLSPETQRRIAQIVTKAAEDSFIKEGDFSAYESSWVISITNALAERGGVDSEAARILGTLLEKMHSLAENAKTTWFRSVADSYKDAAEVLAKAVGVSKADFAAALISAENTEQINQIMSKAFRELKQGQSSFDSFCFAVVTHPKATIGQVKYALERMSWQGQHTVSRSITDPERMALVLLERPWIGVDEALARTSDPQRAFLLLAHAMVEKSGRIEDEMLESRHLTPEIVASLPLAALVPRHAQLPEKLAVVLAAALDQRLISDEHWQTFESLGNEFTGSIEDLLDVIATV